MRWFQKLASSRPPDFVIKGYQGPATQRWWVIPRNRVFNIYLHRWWQSDPDVAMHDHPWLINVSYILVGTYIEHIKNHIRRLKTGDWTARLGHTPHRIEIDPGMEGQVWSLFITGPVIRTWGFHCPKGWRPWREFTQDRDKGMPGAGCD